MKFVLLVLFCTMTYVHGSKILVLTPVNAISHWNAMQAFIRALIKHGHEVTCITSQRIKSPYPQNYTEILVDPPYDMGRFVSHEDRYETALKVERGWETPMTWMLKNFAYDPLNHALSTKKVQNFIRRTDLHFDLVINEDIFYDALLAFGHQFNAPVVTICPYGINDFFDHEMGLLTPISHVSHTLLPYSDRMSFTERLHNVLYSVYDWYLRRTIHIPLQTDLIQKHFGHLKPLPSVDQLRKNISLTFVNAHRSFTSPRPSMPGLIYIGGAHVKPAKRLPNDLEKFLNEAEHGVILFSLGISVKASKMPKDTLNTFIETFRKLKQRVLWKFEEDIISNLPVNVRIEKWLPQNDILAHPNVRLFISHGGLYSSLETLSHGVQVIMIPFAFDQYRNARWAEDEGYGRLLEFRYINNDSLSMMLDEMLNSDRYSKRTKEISLIFKTNILDPMDEFIWWVEYVIKFRGAKHLKSAAADMTMFSYLLMDFFLLGMGLLGLVVFIMFLVVKRIFRGLRVENLGEGKKIQ